MRAGQAGVVQQVAVEVGQSVADGAPLAKIVVPDHLQARLKIPDASTQDVALGLAATIDTRTGVVPGEVVRIDPAAQNGSVTVDVRITAPLPSCAGRCARSRQRREVRGFTQRTSPDRQDSEAVDERSARCPYPVS